MAVVGRLSKRIINFECTSRKLFLSNKQDVLVTIARNVGFFKHLTKEKEHNQKKYEYEVTSDPKEWEFVEQLLPLKTVPEPKPKSVYPSGWRPVKEEAYTQPYFVERSKNHMLSVYLQRRDRGNVRFTKINRIHGDIWGLQNDLKAHLEETLGKKIYSCVYEGNQQILFKGDVVYYVEQWLLSKGF